MRRRSKRVQRVRQPTAWPLSAKHRSQDSALAGRGNGERRKSGQALSAPDLFSPETSEAPSSLKLPTGLPVPLPSLLVSPAWNDPRLRCHPGPGKRLCRRRFSHPPGGSLAWRPGVKWLRLCQKDGEAKREAFRGLPYYDSQHPSEGPCRALGVVDRPHLEHWRALPSPRQLKEDRLMRKAAQICI